MKNQTNPKDIMSCMEVWGGNSSTNKTIEMLGLTSWVYSKPFGNSSHGGDVYYISSCATGRIIRFLIADISGHGIKMGKTAEKLKGLMRRYINQIDQTNFVKSLNKSMTELSRGGLFATSVMGTYFAPTKTLTLTNAGHPFPAYFDSKQAQWRFLEKKQHQKAVPTDIPLGVLALSEYQVLQTQVEYGDIILCYSDAIIECRDSNGDFIGEDGLLDILNNLTITSASQIIPTLLDKLKEMYFDNLTDDDTTLLVSTPNRLFETMYRKPSIGQHMSIMKRMLFEGMKRGGTFPWPDRHLANIGGAMFSSLNKLWGRHLRNKK